jgi:hypothetical protein
LILIKRRENESVFAEALQLPKEFSAAGRPVGYPLGPIVTLPDCHV